MISECQETGAGDGPMRDAVPGSTVSAHPRARRMHALAPLLPTGGAAVRREAHLTMMRMMNDEDRSPRCCCAFVKQANRGPRHDHMAIIPRQALDKQASRALAHPRLSRSHPPTRENPLAKGKRGRARAPPRPAPRRAVPRRRKTTHARLPLLLPPKRRKKLKTESSQ